MLEQQAGTTGPFNHWEEKLLATLAYLNVVPDTSEPSASRLHAIFQGLCTNIGAM